MRTPKLVCEGPQKFIPGTAIRVNPDGTVERVPKTDVGVGDIFLDERQGVPFRIITKTDFLRNLEAGRFQFVGRDDDRWYVAVNSCGLTLHFLLNPPTSPFGRRGEKQDYVWENVPVNAVTFRHVIEPLTRGEELEMKQRFAELRAVWLRETQHLSSATQMAAHPAYREILDLGFHAVPPMLSDLTVRPQHWFIALRELTHDDPVPPDETGYVALMSKRWIKWGKEFGLLP